MSARMCGLVLLLLCVLGGLIAALFTPAIAATLTLPNAQSSTLARPAATPTVNSLATEPVPQATLPANGAAILAHDTFQRPDRRFWGIASDGRTWGGDANSSPAFSISGHAGQISGAKGALQATLNVPGANADILITGTVSWFDANGDINLGGVLRWQDSHNWYKALIDGSKLQVLKDVGGKISVLGTTPFHATGETNYSLRFRALGSNLFAKAWPTNQPEPANWTLMVIDMQLTSGVGGVRVLLASGSVIRITSFLETSVPTAM